MYDLIVGISKLSLFGFPSAMASRENERQTGGKPGSVLEMIIHINNKLLMGQRVWPSSCIFLLFL